MVRTTLGIIWSRLTSLSKPSLSIKCCKNWIWSFKNDSSVSSPSLIRARRSSQTAVSSGYNNSSGNASTKRYPVSVGDNTCFLPDVFINPRLINSSIILARVASVPIPDTAFNCFFNSSFLTNLWISFIACNNVEGVNRDGGFVCFDSTAESVYWTESFFLTDGKWSASSIASFLGPDSAPRSSVKSGSSPSALVLDFWRLYKDFQPSSITTRPLATNSSSHWPTTILVCSYTCSP